MLRVALFTLAALACCGRATATIDYTISLANPEQHLFRVEMQVPDVKESVTVQMPAWNALYQIRDFAARVRQVRATSDRQPKPALVKLDKQTWKVTAAGGTLGSVTLDYVVFWNDSGPFSAQLDSSHAFINFALLLLYVPERRAEEVRVRFSDVPEGWGIATALPSGSTSYSLSAANYDALVDAPVEIGRFEESRLDIGAARVRVVVHGTEYDRTALHEGVRRIVAYQTGLMREVPFVEFVFLYHFGRGGGGMEHANSTAIAAGAGGRVDGVTAHEFFHLWNVKRIRPRSLEPVDYTQENWTRALWFAEGVTSTYGSFTLVRSGLWTREQFYQDLAGEITQLESRPARLWQSVEQASLDAWFEKYQLYEVPDASISYYNKGQILGVLLDILIRDATDNRRSLDDVLRHLNEKFAHQGRFYDDSADVRAATEAVAGRDFGEFFARYVAGTEPLPYDDILRRAGLQCLASEERRPDLGFTVATAPGGGVTAAEVRSGTAAEAAGLRPGDVLLALNGAAFPGEASRWVRDRQPGEIVRLRIRRNGEEKEMTFALGARGGRRYLIRDAEDAGDKQRRIRNGLLRGTTD